MSATLEVRNLTVRIDASVVLRDVSFELETGDALLVLGPNGAGKTVLLRALLGLVPVEGEVRWSPPGPPPGYLPQRLDVERHLPMCGEDLLRAKSALLHLREGEIPAALERVGVSSEIARSPIGHLSGGQFQKVMIALALLGDPRVLMLDEPTTGLDEPSAEHIYDLLRRLQSEGVTIILVSHDLGLAYRFATKVLCLNTRALCFGPPDRMTPETLHELYGEAIPRLRDGDKPAAR
jgi:zinc transport system ATP-binding protein